MENVFVSKDAISKVMPGFDTETYPSMDIDGPGVLVEKESLNAFLSSLGLELINLERSPFEGILMSTVKAGIPPAPIAAAPAPLPEPPAPAGDFQGEVKALNWNGHDEMKKLFTEKLLPVSKKIGLPINVYVPHGCTVTLPTKCKFLGIYIWGMPNGSQPSGATIPETMWGQAVEYRDGTIPNITGVPIETAEGDVIGEIKDKHVFIFFDIAHHSSAFAKAIATRLIAAIEEYFVTGKMTLEDLTEYYRANFVDACLLKSKDFLSKYKQEYEASMAQVREYQQALTSALKRYGDVSKVLARFEGDDKDGFRKKFSDEYSKITDGKRIKKLVVSSAVMSFQTDNVFCTDPRTGEVHDIGELKISVGLNDGKIRFSNIRRTVTAYRDGMHAPHVFPDGNPCLGTASEVVPGLIATMEFAALASYVLSFLESVNTDDSAGSKIYRWPIKGETDDEYKQRMAISVEREKAGNTPWFKVNKEGGKIKVDDSWATRRRA